jgi:Zn-dependent peptidase ImmA (M78 family)
VKVESGKKTINEDVQVLNIDEKATNNLQAIASAFNEYFCSLVEKIYLNNNNNNNNTLFSVLHQQPDDQLQIQHK